MNNPTNSPENEPIWKKWVLAKEPPVVSDRAKLAEDRALDVQTDWSIPLPGARAQRTPSTDRVRSVPKAPQKFVW